MFVCLDEMNLARVEHYFSDFLSKIESRPSKKRPWDYFFFLDVSGHYEDAAMKAALAELRASCPLVKWLGSYPAAN